jgi:hypothetical protein
MVESVSVVMFGSICLRKRFDWGRRRAAIAQSL